MLTNFVNSYKSKLLIGNGDIYRAIPQSVKDAEDKKKSRPHDASWSILKHKTRR